MIWRFWSICSVFQGRSWDPGLASPAHCFPVFFIWLHWIGRRCRDDAAVNGPSKLNSSIFGTNTGHRLCSNKVLWGGPVLDRDMLHSHRRYFWDWNTSSLVYIIFMYLWSNQKARWQAMSNICHVFVSTTRNSYPTFYQPAATSLHLTQNLKAETTCQIYFDLQRNFYASTLAY